MANKISACLVVINEEAVIRRCLESIKDCVDEIILVHDGECSDNTLTIAHEYGAKTFIKPFNGEAEIHRVFAFEQATGDWIMHIDADEYFEEPTRKQIRRLVEDPKVDAYLFRWPLYNGKEYFKMPHNYSQKVVLLRKSKMFFLGMVHETPKTYGVTNVRLDLTLEHKPKYNNYTYKRVSQKWKKWYELLAQNIVGLENLPAYNIPNKKNSSTYLYYEKVRAQPYLVLIKGHVIKDFINTFFTKNSLFFYPWLWKIQLYKYMSFIYLAGRIRYYKKQGK
jgi:glycosyltransferase involved in cell wall biosynthesis